MVDSESESTTTKSNVNQTDRNSAQTNCAVPADTRASSQSLNHDYQPPANSQIPGQFNHFEQHYRRISEDLIDEANPPAESNRSNASVYKNTLPRLSLDGGDDAKKSHSKSNGSSAGTGDSGGGGGGEYNEKCTSFTPIANSVVKADFEQAIELTGYGKFHYLLLAICGLVSTSEEMDVISMSFILPSAQCDLELNTQTKGWLNSIIFIGMMVGAYMWGSIADTLGRRKVLIVISFMNAVCIVASSFCQTYLLFMIFRFLNGVA